VLTFLMIAPACKWLRFYLAGIPKHLWRSESVWEFISVWTSCSHSLWLIVIVVDCRAISLEDRSLRTCEDLVLGEWMEASLLLFKVFYLVHSSKGHLANLFSDIPEWSSISYLFLLSVSCKCLMASGFKVVKNCAAHLVVWPDLRWFSFR
jgi:hypothetical protein